MDKLMLAVGILWSLFTLYGIILLFPPMDRQLRELEIKLKHGKRINRIFAAPSRLQRVVFLLLTCLMMTVAFAAACHRDLRATIGINSGVACSLMIILPALCFALGWRKRKSGQRFGK